MSGGVHGGRFCVINGITGARNWQINDNGQLSKYVNSATAIGSGRKPGTTSWGGGFAGHGPLPPVMPGDLFGFTGFTAPDDEILGHQGPAYSGNAMCESVVVNWDWASGNVLDYAVTFSGHLGLTSTLAAYPYADVGISDPPPVTPCHIDYSSDGTTWTVLGNVTQANLQIVNAVQPYVNSSTSGTTGRRAGVMDWTASIGIEDTLLGGGMTKFANYQFRIYTTASLFWFLKWGVVKEFTGLSPQAETGAIISHGIALEMTAQVSGVLGKVVVPGGSPSAPWWGSAS